MDTVPGYSVARVLSAENSDTLGAGILRQKNNTFDWTMKYDEIIFVTKGTLSIIHEGKRYDGTAGDTIYIRRGTPVTYLAEGEGEGAYVIFPVWWKEQLGPQ